MTEIVVYVRSNRLEVGSEGHQDPVFKYSGHGGHLRDFYVIGNAVEGRLLEPESLALVQAVNRLGYAPEDQVRYVDVGSWRGWLEALKDGVWLFPALRVDGVKHQGAGEARRAVRELEGEKRLPTPQPPP